MIVSKVVILEGVLDVVKLLKVVGDAIVVEEGVRMGKPQFRALWPKWSQRTALPLLFGSFRCALTLAF